VRSVVSALFVLGAIEAGAAEAPIWQFDGRFGPDQWSHLNSDYEMCTAGKQQSPIDIAGAFDTSLFIPVADWAREGWQVGNTGNFVVAKNAQGGVTSIGEENFSLYQIDFRLPAEHLVHGKRHPMEAQFHHRSESGERMIFSVFFEANGQNDALETLVGHAPRKSNKKPNGVVNVDLNELLPDLSDRWVYRGSLTYPPCDEGHLWMVFMDPVPVSNASILAFDALHRPSARPIQPLYGRFVLTD